MATYDSYQNKDGNTVLVIHRKNGDITERVYPKGKKACRGGSAGWQRKDSHPLLKCTKEGRQKLKKSFVGF